VKVILTAAPRDDLINPHHSLVALFPVQKLGDTLLMQLILLSLR